MMGTIKKPPPLKKSWALPTPSPLRAKAHKGGDGGVARRPTQSNNNEKGYIRSDITSYINIKLLLFEVSSTYHPPQDF